MLTAEMASAPGTHHKGVSDSIFFLADVTVLGRSRLRHASSILEHEPRDAQVCQTQENAGTSKLPHLAGETSLDNHCFEGGAQRGALRWLHSGTRRERLLAKF